QIDAGYPIYAQPSVNSGMIEYSYDVGAVVPGSKITVQPEYTILDGTPTISYDIAAKENLADPWTTYSGVTQAYATTFQYVKITVDVTASGGDDLVKFDNLTTNI